MKQNITLCLDREVIESLQETGNKSGTANDVLRDYFNKGKPLIEVKKEKLQTAEKLMNEADELETEIQREERINKEQKAKMDAEYDIEMAEKKQRVSDMMKATWRESFTKNWNIPPERLEDLFNEFVELNERKETTILEFMQFKLINPKQKKNSES